MRMGRSPSTPWRTRRRPSDGIGRTRDARAVPSSVRTMRRAGYFSNQAWMVRTLDGTARAFLSDRYHRMDDDAFAEVVLPAISETPGAEVESCGITGCAPRSSS